MEVPLSGAAAGRLCQYVLASVSISSSVPIRWSLCVDTGTICMAASPRALTVSLSVTTLSALSTSSTSLFPVYLFSGEASSRREAPLNSACALLSLLYDADALVAVAACLLAYWSICQSCWRRLCV